MLDPLTLHHALVDNLKRRGYIRTAQVEAAFRAVPRHLFLPDMALRRVYRDRPVPLKWLNNELVSSSSQPAMMALMLEQLDLRPGCRVLEIGAGSGYNAALIAHIVGDAGQVVTVDIDAELTTKAERHLARAGWASVVVVCADGGFGYPAAAPYDRIILTVGAEDIAPAWWEQLAAGGRLVLPLSVKGPQLSAAFDHAGGCLTGVSIVPCGFVLLRGAFADPGQSLKLGSVLLVGLARLTLLLKRFGRFQPTAWLERFFGPDEVLAYRQLESLLAWNAAGRSTTMPFRIRAYPPDLYYTPAATETVARKEWTQFVLGWG